MSYTESARKPSLAPELVILVGSMLAMSPVLASVRVPPGCPSDGGAVAGVSFTLPMPVLICVTPFGTAVEAVVLFVPDVVTLVVVLVLTVVAVTPPTGAEVVGVVSPGASEVGVASVVLVLVAVGAAFFDAPPQAAA